MKHVVPEHPVFRPGTVDRQVWANVIELNEYRLPDVFGCGDAVLDVGAHTGAASWRCAFSGARVVAVEAARENYHLLMHNLRPVWDRVLTVHAAAWRSDRRGERLELKPNWQPANTGGSSVLPAVAGRGHDVLALPLDDLLLLEPSWRLLKIDCEGSEFFCLYFSRELSRVREIAGEYHELHDDRSVAEAGRPCTMAELQRHLEGQGFAVETAPAPDNPRMGLFWARR